MLRDYYVVSPSLDGVLSHESLAYEGISRPVEILRALDGPAADPACPLEAHESKILERYFFDLYGVFMKHFSIFALAVNPSHESTIKLQAMLQEMIKIKRISARGQKETERKE